MRVVVTVLYTSRATWRLYLSVAPTVRGGGGGGDGGGNGDCDGDGDGDDADANADADADADGEEWVFGSDCSADTPSKGLRLALPRQAFAVVPLASVAPGGLAVSCQALRSYTPGVYVPVRLEGRAALRGDNECGCGGIVAETLLTRAQEAAAAAAATEDGGWASAADVPVCATVSAVVISVNKYGCFVALSPTVCG